MDKREIRYTPTSIDSVETINTSNGTGMSLAHNIRRTKNGGIESSCQPQLQFKITSDNGFELMFQHTIATSINHLIAKKESEIHYVEIEDNEVVSIAKIMDIEDDLADFLITMFSMDNMLFIEFKDGENIKKEFVFQWYNSKYFNRALENISPPKPVSIDYVYTQSTDIHTSLPSKIIDVTLDKKTNSSDGSYTAKEYDYIYKEYLDTFISGNYIHGTIFLIFAYKMIDGTIVKHSSIVPLDMQRENISGTKSLYFRVDDDILSFYQTLYAIKPTLSFDVPQEIKDNPLIESLVVYSTRNSPIYAYENIYDTLNFQDTTRDVITIEETDYNIISSRSIIDQQNIAGAQNVFYKIHEVDIANEDSVTLTFNEHYNNIEQCEIFTPNLSNLSLTGNVKYENNGMLHLFDVDMKFFGTDIYSSNNEIVILQGTRYRNRNYSHGKLFTRVAIALNGEYVFVENETPISTYYIENSSAKYIILPNMINYQDIRAKNISMFFKDKDGNLFFIQEVALKQSPENGYAYYQNIAIDKPFSQNALKISEDSSIIDHDSGRTGRLTNRVAISEVNNPLVFKHGNIIDINTLDTTIYGVESSARQLYEESYGLYPLYIFTNKGIYTLQRSGGEIVYNEAIRIHSLSVNCPTCALQVYDNLYFITNEGVYSIAGSNCKHLSLNLNNYSHLGTLFLDFIKGAKMVFKPIFDEILIYNYFYNYCYVYDIASGGFYTRDFEFKCLVNNLFLGGNGIYNFNYAETKLLPLYSQIETLPTCYESEYRKKVGKISFVGMMKSNSSIEVLGSQDGVEWSVIGRSERVTTLSKTLSSWRYFKLRVDSAYLYIDFIKMEITEKKFK